MDGVGWQGVRIALLWPLYFVRFVFLFVSSPFPISPVHWFFIRRARLSLSWHFAVLDEVEGIKRDVSCLELSFRCFPRFLKYA